jgi:tetratricopeptide (TPR) repeat protein
LVEQARPAIERSGDHAALASLELAAAFVEHHSCQFAAGFAACMRSIEHARQAQEFWLVRHTRFVAAAILAFGPTPVDDGLSWLDKAQMESGSTFESGLEVSRVLLLTYMGRLDEARSLFAATTTRMAERGLMTGVAMSAQIGWEVEMLAGDSAAAERVARQGCEQLEQLGERAWLSTLACQLGEALYSLGRYDESEEWVRRGLEVGASNDVVTQQLGLQVRSKLLARRSDNSKALSLAEEADGVAGTTDSPVQHGDAALNLAEVLYITGDPTRAAQEVQRAIDHYERRGASGCVARARRVAATWTM